MTERARKPQFKEPSKAQLLGRERIERVGGSEIAECLLGDVKPDQAFVLGEDILRRYKSDRKFRKHGPEIRLLPSNFTAEEARALTISLSQRKNRRDRSVPLFLRESEIERQLKPYRLPSGFHIYPLRSWRDKMPRKISLYNVVGGHRIFADGGVTVTIYGDAMKVSSEGAEAIASVPSMRQIPDYKFKLEREPLHDNSEGFIIGTSFRSSHECEEKSFNGMRYKYVDDPEDSKIVNVCQHDCAARYGAIETSAAEGNGDGILKNSIVPLLSKRFAQGAARGLDSLLVADKDVKDKVRRPRAGELEAVYWLMVYYLGAKEALYSHLARDGKIKNYDWTMRK